MKLVIAGSNDVPIKEALVMVECWYAMTRVQVSLVLGTGGERGVNDAAERWATLHKVPFDAIKAVAPAGYGRFNQMAATHVKMVAVGEVVLVIRRPEDGQSKALATEARRTKTPCYEIVLPSKGQGL